MNYYEFRSVIREKVEGIKLNDPLVRVGVRNAYNNMPKGLNDIQQIKYAEAYASGIELGSLIEKASSTRQMSGLLRRLTKD